MPSGKLVERKARSLDEGAPQDTPKLKKRALSHAELFGDESEEEDSGLGAGAPRVWPPTLPSLSSDSESDSDSSLGLGETKVPKRLKAAPPSSPAPPSPLSSSSSSSSPSGASQCAEEGVDYSALEKEVDFDVDPMEECLRIFNESTSVKTEDKGRLARQVRALRGDTVPRSSPAGSSLCDPSRSRSFSTGLLTPFKIQEPRWPPLPLHPAQKEDAGFLPTQPASRGSVRLTVQTDRQRGTGGPSRPTPTSHHLLSQLLGLSCPSSPHLAPVPFLPSKLFPLLRPALTHLGVPPSNVPMLATRGSSP